MDDTRVNRFNEYRKSFIKEGAIETDENETATIDVHSTTTSSLSLEEVMNANKQEFKKEDLQKDSKRKHVAIILLKVGISILLLAGLAILGYFAWR